MQLETLFSDLILMSDIVFDVVLTEQMSLINCCCTGICFNWPMKNLEDWWQIEKGWRFTTNTQGLKR